MADGRVTIPCPGPVESLNAAVAGSLLLYEASRQQVAESVRTGGGAMSLFDDGSPMSCGCGVMRASRAPLAERMRPRTLDEYVGQEHLLGPGKPLRLAIEGMMLLR